MSDWQKAFLMQVELENEWDKTVFYHEGRAKHVVLSDVACSMKYSEVKRAAEDREPRSMES